MKKRDKNNGIFSGFNPWLFLICILLAALIWVAVMFIKDPDGVRDETATALLPTQSEAGGPEWRRF